MLVSVGVVICVGLRVGCGARWVVCGKRWVMCCDIACGCVKCEVWRWREDVFLCAQCKTVVAVVVGGWVEVW